MVGVWLSSSSRPIRQPSPSSPLRRLRPELVLSLSKGSAERLRIALATGRFSVDRQSSQRIPSTSAGQAPDPLPTCWISRSSRCKLGFMDTHQKTAPGDICQGQFSIDRGLSLRSGFLAPSPIDAQPSRTLCRGWCGAISSDAPGQFSCGTFRTPRRCPPRSFAMPPQWI